MKSKGNPQSTPAFDTSIEVRPMRESDLAVIGVWLQQSHVRTWWQDAPSLELEAIRRRLRGEKDTATQMLLVTENRHPVGWCQWYLWSDYPVEGADVGVRSGDVGMDYAIGETTAIARGVGRQMIGVLVREIRRQHPGAGFVVAPAEANRPSRSVLEHNGFHLVDVRRVATEPTGAPLAIYRLEPQPVRVATVGDAQVIGLLLDQFNREFDEPTPGPETLSSRIAELISCGDTEVVLGGSGPDGLAVLRFRPSLWTRGSECNLAELYVVPEHRGRGLGRALMHNALTIARKRDVDWMDIGVDEPDSAARHLYESLGFTNRSGGPDGPPMFLYEREL